MTNIFFTRATPTPLASRFAAGASSAAFKSLVTGALLIGLIVTSACSGTPASAPSPNTGGVALAAEVHNEVQQVTITVGQGMSFDPAAITVRAGQPVELTLRNVGQFPHDFTLTEGVLQPVKITANAGQTASRTFTVEKSGTYNFECSMPGHALAGMRGTITVQ